MKIKDKQQLIEKIKELDLQQKYEEIADLIINADIERDDEINILFAKALIDMSDDHGESLLDMAESALTDCTNFRDDPECNYQYSRILFYRERYVESYRYVFKALTINKLFPSLSEEDQKEYEEFSSIVSKEAEKITKVSYLPPEEEALTEHIKNYFGEISQIIDRSEFLGITLKIAEVPPSDKHNYYTFVTMGFGAHKMDIPPEVAELTPDRFELVMYMPPEMDDDDRIWALDYLSMIGRSTVERSSWTGYGHIYSYSVPIAKNTKLCGSVLIELQNISKGARSCIIPCGDDVAFYQVFPLYREEILYKWENGLGELIDLMPHISPVVDFNRENVCSKSDKSAGSKNSGSRKHNMKLLADEIDYVSKLNIGTLCSVSKKIIEDGCRVSYMRRLYLDMNMEAFEPQQVTHSGWLMLSGKESGKYIADMNNFVVCSLNTICNIDNEIVPFLTLPYGTIVGRNSNGKLKAQKPDKDLDLHFS